MGLHSQSELAGGYEGFRAALVLALVLAVGVGAVDGLHVVPQDGEALQHQAALVARLRADPGRGGGLGRRLGFGMVDLWPVLKFRICSYTNSLNLPPPRKAYYSDAKIKLVRGCVNTEGNLRTCSLCMPFSFP